MVEGICPHSSSGSDYDPTAGKSSARQAYWLFRSHLPRQSGIVAVVHWIAKGAIVPWDSKNQFYAFFRFLD